MERSFEGNRVVTVFGGSGFVGRHLVRALARRGWRVKVAVRRPERAFHLQPLGAVGQIVAVQANLRFPASIERALAGASAVVNLTGILAESGAQRFDAIHRDGARAVAEAAAAAGIERFVHMSALGAALESDSLYARSKFAGEKAVAAVLPQASIIRPSIQFGPEDGFFNRFASIARMSPVVPLIGANIRFQPVFVGDVASAIAACVDGEVAAGRIYELGGAEIRTMRQCLELIVQEIDRRRILLPVPFPLAALIGTIAQYLPGKLLTADQVRQLQHDNVVSAAAIAEGRTLEAFGIVPTGLAAIMPLYLERYRPRGQFDRRRPA